MNSFKEFLSEEHSSDVLPLFHTVFGNHSKENDSKEDKNFTTVFGKHSNAKDWLNAYRKEYNLKPLPMQNEAVEPTTARDQISAHSKQAEKDIHDTNKLKDDKDQNLMYHSTESYQTNSTLHSHANGKKVYSQQVNGLDKIMSKARIRKDTHVFTGIQYSPEKFFKKKNRGETATTHLPAFTSTTTDFNQAIGFGFKMPHDLNKHPAANNDAPPFPDGKMRSAHHVLKLHVPAGTPGGSIRHLAEYQDENEVLLHRGLNIEIHPHPTITHHPERGHVVVWHARVVGHDPKDFPKM